MNKAFLARCVTLAFLAAAALSLPSASASANMVRDCSVCWSECEGYDNACRDAGGTPNLCSCSLNGNDCYVGDCYIVADGD